MLKSADGGEAAAVDVVILKIAINSGIISAGASAFPLAWPPIVVKMFQMYAVASASAIGDSLSADWCRLTELTELIVLVGNIDRNDYGWWCWLHSQYDWCLNRNWLHCLGTKCNSNS